MKKTKQTKQNKIQWKHSQSIPSDFIGSVSTVSNMRLIYIWIYLVQSEDQSVVFLTASSCVSLYADDLIVSTCVSLAPPPFLSIRTSCFTHVTVCLFECLNHMLFFLLLVFLILCWIFFFLIDIWRHFVFHLLVPHPFSWYLVFFSRFSLTLFTWLSVKPQWVNDQIYQRHDPHLFSPVTNPKTMGLLIWQMFVSLSENVGVSVWTTSLT